MTIINKKRIWIRKRPLGKRNCQRYDVINVDTPRRDDQGRNHCSWNHSERTRQADGRFIYSIQRNSQWQTSCDDRIRTITGGRSRHKCLNMDWTAGRLQHAEGQTRQIVYEAPRKDQEECCYFLINCNSAANVL